jgi:hypothetical protein
VRKIREALSPTSLATLRQARIAVDQVWQRLSAHSSSPDVAAAVNELKSLLASDQFWESLDAIAAKTKTVMEAYKQAYLTLFNRRTETYEKAIEDIRNRPEWEPIAQTNRELANTLLAPLLARIGNDADKTVVEKGTGLGNASLTEMESDLAAVDALRASALVELQKLSIGGDTKAPVRRLRIADIFNRPIQTQKDLDMAIDQLRESLQKFIDEGAAIILE